MNDSRRVVAENLRAMIDKDDLSVRGFAARHGLQQKAIDRMVKGEHAASVDTLDELARALGLMTWQLLVPGLDTSNPPHIAITESEVRLYKRLSELIKTAKH